MKFKVDENLPRQIAEMLRAAGHDALTVLEQGMGGSRDPDLAALVRAEGRALITLDLDFPTKTSIRPVNTRELSS